MSAITLVKWTITFCICCLLSGCKEVLYSNLAERDANDMVSILEASNIDVKRARDKDGIYELLVDKTNIAAANVILKGQGYPRRNFKPMDEVFSAEGLVGSPFEERVRYMYALDEKLTETLISIDGVRDARVTVNIPEPTRFSDTSPPSKASVVLHYEQGFAVRESVPKIKTLLANAVAGLDYDNVAVVVFAAGGTVAIPNIPEPMFGAANATDAQQASTNGVVLINQTVSMSALVNIGIQILLALVVLFGVVRAITRRLGLRWSE